MTIMQRFSPQGSLQRRLSLMLSFGFLVLWLLGTVAAGLILREEINEVFDSALQEVVQRVLPLAYTEILARESGDAMAQHLPAVGAHREYITYLVRDDKSRVLLQSHDAAPERFPQNPAPGFLTDQNARFYTEHVVKGTIIVTAAERPGHRQNALYDAMTMLLWPLALLLPLSILGTWGMIALAFRPVKRLRDEIGDRGGGNLTPLGITHLPGEIAPIAEAINRLMERLRRTLDAERSFTANSAHELRTPIAAALAQTQRLRAELSEPQHHARAGEIELALHRLARLSEKLLQLAKAEGSALLAEKPVNLVPVLEIVMGDFARSPTFRARMDIHMPEHGTVLSHIDMDAFAILARNLIENALKHGDPAQPVRISLDDHALFSVSNRGAILPPEHLDRLTRRFARGTSEAEGAGLGLAIVAAIAAGSGSTLNLYSPATTLPDGFEVRIQLPEPHQS
jgi:two-component system, OmpR family, sensor kinase